jgi:hypothetical protein
VRVVASHPGPDRVAARDWKEGLPVAKLTLNSALASIRGRIDNWVYRKLGNRVYLSRPVRANRAA